MLRAKNFFLLACLLFLSACQPQFNTVEPSTVVLTLPPTVTEGPSLTPVPTATITPIPPTLTATPIALERCSPLEDISIQELPEIISNPFERPRPGEDSGHHGVDFAYYRRGTHAQMDGLSIYSVFPGIVADVITNRLPYGNAIIIETPLSALPSGWLESIQLPTPDPFLTPDPRLICPSIVSASASPHNMSLYILYAHMQEPTALNIDDSVSCGQVIGAVGNTGASGNAHLHFEARLGPSGMRLGSLSHYNTQATPQEIKAYCTWRVSGVFSLLDPSVILFSAP